MNKVSLLGILFLFSLVVVQGSVESYQIINEITTPQPIIEITYNEQPIIIHDFALRFAEGETLPGDVPDIYYSSDASYACSHPAGGTLQVPTQESCRGKQFNFSVQGFLFDRKYQFYANTSDSDHNYIQFYVNFTVEAQLVDMLLLQPTVRYDATLKYGAAQENPVTTRITFYPEYPRYPLEACYYGWYSLDGYLRQQLNLGLTQNAFVYLRDTVPENYFTPLTPLSDLGANIKNGVINFTPIEQPGLYTQGNFEELTIICNESNSNRYHVEQVHIGYDTTPPVISAEFLPSTIIDAGWPRTFLSISTDDASVCIVSNTAYSPANYPLPSDWSRFTSWENYTKERMLPFDFSGRLSGCPCNYTFELSCENYAGLITQNSLVNVSIAIERNIDITSNTERYHGATTFELSVFTNIRSSCSYTYDNTNWQVFPRVIEGLTKITHNATATVPAVGDYDFIVRCTQGQSIASTTLEITIDNDNPTPPVITFPNDPLCTDRFRATVESTDATSGIDYYNYTIKNSTRIIADGISQSSSISKDIRVKSNQQYTLTVTAYDNAGRKSTATSKSLYYRNSTHIDCDTQDPTGWAFQNRTTSLVSISCVDEGSGCTTNYGYALVAKTASCSRTPLLNKTYANKLTVSEETKICWRVWDKAGNSASGQGIYDIVEIEELCENDERDTGELGVDCGGICTRVCAIEAECGDGEINTDDEECDGGHGSLTCEDFSMESGLLSCDNTRCQLDTTNCISDHMPPVCSDGIIQPGETCDGTNFGSVLTCTDLSNDFTGGELTCTSTCHFDTSACTKATPLEQECEYNTDCEYDVEVCVSGICVAKVPSDECVTDEQCQLDEECIAGTCIQLSNGDVDGDGLPDWWEEEHFGCAACADPAADPDGDGIPNIDEYFAGTDPNDPKSKPKGLGPSTLSIILLIVGLVLFLGGIGYLLYDKYYGAGSKASSVHYSPSSTFGESSTLTAGGLVEEESQVPASVFSQEDPLLKKEMEATARKRIALQRKLGEKRKLDKKKKRDELLSSFKDDTIVSTSSAGQETQKTTKESDDGEEITKTADVKTTSQPKVLSSQKTTVQEKTDTSVTKKKSLPTDKKTPASALNDVPAPGSRASQKKDAFADLTKLVSKEKSSLTQPSSKELFLQLSTMSGASPLSIRNVMNKQRTSAKDLTALFKDAKKSDVTPKTLTPMLAHLVEKGHVDKEVAHQTVHSLAEQELLTETQKKKILKDLHDDATRTN